MNKTIKNIPFTFNTFGAIPIVLYGNGGILGRIFTSRHSDGY